MARPSFCSRGKSICFDLTRFHFPCLLVAIVVVQTAAGKKDDDEMEGAVVVFDDENKGDIVLVEAVFPALSVTLFVVPP